MPPFPFAVYRKPYINAPKTQWVHWKGVNNPESGADYIEIRVKNHDGTRDDWEVRPV